MNDAMITHMVTQGVFNDNVASILKGQSKVNKLTTWFIIMGTAYAYFTTKKIGKLTTELKELKQTKGV